LGSRRRNEAGSLDGCISRGSSRLAVDSPRPSGAARAYEGLSAVLFEAEFIDTETRQNVFPWSGVIFPGV
jgi:hypothetical protein